MKKTVVLIILGLFIWCNCSYGATCDCADKNQDEQAVVNTRRPHRGIRFRSTAGLNGGMRSLMPMERSYYTPYVRPATVAPSGNAYRRSRVVNVAPQFPPQAPSTYEVIPGKTAMPYVPGGHGYTVRRY